mmetsp:Transcript_15146/g.38942  ORF Transcript_15146/g.38942 Transcript_15146/m.38942 type:complete len:224 (+) Transcript_15146:714-1385(+)
MHGFDESDTGQDLPPSHFIAMESTPVQGRPPFFECTRMARDRPVCPVPQLALQLFHSAQSLSWQSRGASRSGLQLRISLARLQGATSVVGPSHHLPWALPCFAISRERCLTPSHSQVQSLQWAHALNMQSRDAEQLCVLHFSYSLSLPSGALPHLLASRAIVRWRHLTPPPQVALHGPQRLQPLHSASTQLALQGSVLQGATWLFGPGSQSLPLPLGEVWISR